jgi:hypothetical protein
MERRPTVGVGSRQPRLDAICDRGRTPRDIPDRSANGSLKLALVILPPIYMARRSSGPVG